MLVANTFDLWQKDIFFSAAEEVQASADIMESAYRTWVRQKREGISSIALDELCRELQTALATAKWQLDEFQRAVRTSYRISNIDAVRSTRHEQFVSAISAQISRVEESLKEYFSDQVRKPLRWVNLDEEERDDLAMFLSGNPGSSNSTKDSDSDTKDSLMKNSPKKTNYATNCRDVSHEVLGTSDGSSCDKKASSRRTWGPQSQDVGTLKITIDHDNEEKKSLIESTPKDKTHSWRPRYGNYRINQMFKRAVGGQRQQQTSIHLHRSRSFQVMLVLMLTIFLLVPFVYST